MSKSLDARLLEAHARNDKSALVALYRDAAEAAPSDEARYFYMTHAYIFALETGDPAAVALREKLRAAGREA